MCVRVVCVCVCVCVSVCACVCITAARSELKIFTSAASFFSDDLLILSSFGRICVVSGRYHKSLHKWNFIPNLLYKLCVMQFRIVVEESYSLALGFTTSTIVFWQIGIYIYTYIDRYMRYINVTVFF